MQIVSHPSPFAVFSDELKKKVEEYGNGFFSPWSPQQTLLNHPVSTLRFPPRDSTY